MASSTGQKQEVKTTHGFKTVRRGQPDYADKLSQYEDPSTMRGIVDANGTVNLPCSIKYIHLLVTEILRARSASFIGIADPQKICNKSQKQRLDFIGHEVKRLLRYAALFPSPSIKAKVLALLAIDGALSFDAACSTLIIGQEWRTFDRIWREEVCRPTYLKKSHGWENFLLNTAPGLGMEAKKTEPKSSFQVLPALGLKIVTDFVHEEDQILGFIEQAPAHIDIAPARTTMLVDFDNPHSTDQQCPEADLIRDPVQTTLRPSPFQEALKSKHDQHDNGPDLLENLSRITYRLDGPQPGFHPLQAPISNARLFSMTNIRSFRLGKGQYEVKIKDELL